LAVDTNTDGVMYSLAGGLRIKNISNFNADGKLATSVDYLYHFQADSNHNGIPEFYSTGKLLERPSSIDADWIDYPHPLYIKSESNAQLRIGYDSVIIQQQTSRHKDVFHNACYRPNVYKSYYTGPRPEMMPVGLGSLPARTGPSGSGLLYADIYFDYKPEGIKDFQDNANGKLEQSIDYVYDSVIGQYKVLREIDNSYTGTGTGIGGIIWADRIYAAQNGVFAYCLTGLPIEYGATNFFYPAMRSEAILPIQNLKKEYVGADSIVTVTSYLYNSENQLRRTTVTNSKGKSDIKETYYPIDYQGAGGVVQEMATRHMLDYPVEQISKADSFTVGGAYNLYQLHDNIITPSLLYTLNINAPISLNLSAPSNMKDSRYEPRLLYSFNADGNIDYQQKFGDAKTSYIWDYAKSYPVCQVQNADTREIAYTSFEADGTGNWYLNGGTVDTTQGITGRSSYKNRAATASGLNPATTYIVSYWSQNGAYSIPGTISGYPVQGKTVSFHTPAWTLYVHKVTGQSSITVSATGHIDELRLYPSTAQMTTYTYDPLVGITSQMDAGSRATYYEYDGLQRLKRVRDQDYNILKTIQYAYQAPAGCGNGCQSVAMQTFAGTNTLSYPVGVFDVNGALLGNASNASAYVGLWNNDTADARVGILSAGQDSMHFNLTLNAGQTMPASVTG